MNNPIKIAGQPLSTPTAVVDYPNPTRLVSGNPQRLSYPFYEHPQMACGVWTCEVGAWRIAFAENKQEFFNVLAGRLRISDTQGSAHEYAAGEAGVIPPGFTGTFEVLEPVRKYYVVVES